jgi:hypothetical protein
MSFLWRALLSLSLIDEEPLSGAASSIQRLGRRELPGPLVAAAEAERVC